MGLHTGPVAVLAGGYVGMTVHRAARIASAAHGGQILVSNDTRTAASGALSDVDFLDLGSHRLKDIVQPERLFQVTAPGLRSDFPFPLSREAHPTNLPKDLPSFVGRHEQLEQISAQFAEHRLLTLTGPGGVGKTRLAMEAASRLRHEFRDGVFVVRLAAINDPDLVLSSITNTLSIREEPNRSLAETVVDHLHDRHLLLVLDNFEHVLAAAESIGSLMSHAPSLHLLVTSRSPLRVASEQVMPIPPLAVPVRDADRRKNPVGEAADSSCGGRRPSIPVSR